MSTPRAAKRYAKSLFSLSEEKGLIEHMENDVRQIQDAIANSHELELLLKSPVVKAHTKEKILVRIFDHNISDLTLEFMRILVRKGRESILPAIIQEILGLVRNMRNVRLAEVKTAVPMDDALRTRVSDALKHLHDGDVELHETIDPSLLGGFQLLMDNRMVDASIKREIDLLRRRITDHDYEPEL
jgi:F-type H+-transporting ATPase subunit delta